MSQQEESQVVAKVEELMKALDQVKRYRALSRLMVDFGIIMLLTVALFLAGELAADFYNLATGSSSLLPFAGLWLILIPAAGLLAGTFWVDRRLKQVKVGGWNETLREGFPGAVKLLQEMRWDDIFEDIRASKIGYTIYFGVKVIGYWLLAFVILAFPYEFAISAFHLEINLYILALLSLVLVVVLSRGDLQRRYQQVVSLDVLMWDLRWFSSGFREAKFEA